MKNKEFLTMGRYGEELENNFSHYNNNEFVIAMSSGTAALESILLAYDISGKDVAVPSNTFTATIVAIEKAGGRPVYIDIDDDMGMCFEDLKLKKTQNMSAVLIVHIGGYISPNINKIKQFCLEQKLFLFEDAAHAMGSEFNGVKAGNFGDAAAFSLFSTKLITAGEGGIVCCNDKEKYNKILIMRDHGQKTDNVVTEKGYNWRLGEFHSILALNQLKNITRFIEIRRKSAEIYDEYFLNNKKLNRIQHNEKSKSNYYKYILMPNFEINVEEFYKIMKEKYNIMMAGRVYPIPCHQQKAFEVKGLRLIKTEYISKRHICVPIFSDMKEKEVHYIGESIIEALSDY